ncbi:MAG: methionine gamma-lyase family protein, partial [Cyanobacteriota bacterium]
MTTRWARDQVAAALEQIAPLVRSHTAAVQPRLAAVLAAMAAERVGTQHFASVSGYGHGDQGRDTLDRVFARVLQAEAAAVRLQFVSGTHAITAALFGVLRPGDRLLALTGRPYDTLEEVIGLRGNGMGSLADFGIVYDELPLTPAGLVDEAKLDTALGADLIAGSLIKNLGGTIAPAGGYVAGQRQLVEQACCRLTA